MSLEKLREHASRVRYTLGQRITIGSRRYRRRGYHSDRLATEPTEEFLLPVLREALKRPGAFIDVGVNVGQTLIKILSVDAGRQYVGFEPQMDCCYYVGQFLRANDLFNASIVPVALSDKNGLFPIYADGPDDATASLLPVHVQRPPRERASWCQARIGDEVLSELGIDRISAIKVDVEGFEYEVLRGLTGTLTKQKPPILFEVLDNYAWGKLVDEAVRAVNSARADQIFALLSGLGYTVSRIDAAGDTHPIERFELDVPPPNGFGEGRDYVAR